MKILFLLTQDLESPSGFGRYFPLAKELVNLGHQVWISATHSDFKSIKETKFIKSGVHIHYVGPMHVLKKGSAKIHFSPGQLIFNASKSTWGLSIDAITAQADIVHICKPHPMNSIAGILTKLKKGQLYLDVDDYEMGYLDFRSNWQRKIVSYFEEIIPLQVDYLTVNSIFMMNRLVNKGLSSEKILYLPNGIDLERISAPQPEKLRNLKLRYDLEGKQVVSYIGSMNRVSHPVDLLLEAFAILLHHQPNTILLLVGGGDDYERLQQLPGKFGISQNVIFCGRISQAEVLSFYYISDLTVDMVADTDVGKARVPLKLFESLACGIPFVTADVGDRSMLLGSPPAGILTQPGDPVDLANGMNRLLSDSDLANKLVILGKKNVQQFSWKILAKKMESFYRQNLARAVS